MTLLIVCVAAFAAAILTFFSGFGLGTILTPVFMLFFPVDLAIGLTGAVHFCNNIFKLFLVGRKLDVQVALRFGIPAVIAAFAGSMLLLLITDLAPLFSYEFFSKTFVVYPVKFIVAVLLLIFATMEFMPYFKKLQFDKNKLPLGGILSGFFGGLSGNQGALRSAFLIRAGLTKESFIATAVVISAFIDLTRLSVYSSRLAESITADQKYLVLFPALSAMAGAIIGNKLLKKVTLTFVQTFVAVLLLVFSILMALGWI